MTDEFHYNRAPTLHVVILYIINVQILISVALMFNKDKINQVL